MAPTRKKSSGKKAPWNKAAPKKSRHTKLTPAKKAQAKRSAKRAGRKYPNLVDNMRAAASQRRKKKPTGR
jgi:N-acetyl-anhydromuramyl-L-alanine amidase AmpD